jgi:hypothetical protein
MELGWAGGGVTVWGVFVHHVICSAIARVVERDGILWRAVLQLSMPPKA